MLARAALSMLVASMLARTATAEEAPLAVGTPAPAGVPAPAAEPTIARAYPPLAERRILNGHVFMPSAEVPGALTTTSFGTFLVIGYGQTSASFQFNNKTYSGSFDYAGAGAVLGYEYAFMKYFSARFTLGEVIYSGIDGKSAIVVGTSLQIGASLGATASVPIGDSLRVGILFDVESSPGLGLTIGNGLQTLINNCQADNCLATDANVFYLHRALVVQPALAANWAPWRPLGFTANAAYLHVSQGQGSDTFTADAVRLSGAADWDFFAVSSVPIGLQLAFSWTAPINGEILQHVTDFGGGIFYTGAPHLALGLQLTSRRFAVQPTVNVSWSTFISTIGLRYYW